MSENSSFFSQICVAQCRGRCCDPWWGIISYTVVRKNIFAGLNDFKAELLKGINERAKRIIEGYKTSDTPPRPLFNLPERYNISITDIKINGSSAAINILAMFAFRCLFLSQDKTCAIHPSYMNDVDIRPPHCGFMGSLNAKPGEKGYCRIIHAAQAASDSSEAIKRAMGVEGEASGKYYREGVNTAEEASEAIINSLKEYQRRNTAKPMSFDTTSVPGRNDPCYCGSGKKYKKCHGR